LELPARKERGSYDILYGASPRLVLPLGITLIVIAVEYTLITIITTRESCP
jgi:hypothetical protein